MLVKRFIPAVVIAMLLVPASARAQEEVIDYHTDAAGAVRME